MQMHLALLIGRAVAISTIVAIPGLVGLGDRVNKTDPSLAPIAKTREGAKDGVRPFDLFDRSNTNETNSSLRTTASCSAHKRLDLNPGAAPLRNLGVSQRLSGERHPTQPHSPASAQDSIAAAPSEADASWVAPQTLVSEGDRLRQDWSAESTRKAIDNYTKAVALFSEANRRADEAQTLLKIGQAEETLGNLQQALRAYQQALAIFKTTRDRSGQTNALTRVGRVFFTFSDDRQALAV